MRQIGAERDDPLVRIQQEISEVTKREMELRNEHNRTSGGLNDAVDNDDCVSSTHSEDSGFSTSPSPVHNSPAKVMIEDDTVNEIEEIKISTHEVGAKEPPTKVYTLPQSKALQRAVSTPQLFQVSPMRRFNVNPNQRGLMQRFIATRGKLAITKQSSVGSTRESQPTKIEVTRSPIHIPPTAISAPIIERDERGRPIRPGYVPVGEKIQQELRDLKTRESELKRLRKQKMRESQPDLLSNDEDYDSGEISDTEDQTDYAPGKLRTSKSIGELCDALNNSSLQDRETPSPQFERPIRHGGLRPALSLAQLCDLDAQEEPVVISSHKLIAQWENFIKQKQQKTAV